MSGKASFSGGMLGSGRTLRINKQGIMSVYTWLLAQSLALPKYCKFLQNIVYFQCYLQMMLIGFTITEKAPARAFS